MARRDLLLGVLFFLGMGAFGAVMLYVTRDKWQTEMRREEQRHRVFQAHQRIDAARSLIAKARNADAGERQRYAEDAAGHLTYAIEVNPGVADLYADRAEAHLLMGNREAARKDVARAKELVPSRDWSDLEKRCALTP